MTDTISKKAKNGLAAIAFSAFASMQIGAAIAEDGVPISTPAEFAIIMDFDTGEALFSKNADVQTAPASMSKLMTVAITFDLLKSGSLSLDDKFDVSKKAWRMGGSKMWVRVDTQITVENLLRGVIIQSGNDACIVLAENIAGSEEAFAELMNRKAREWGLNDSTFANASGWPHPDHKMSMRDLGELARKLIKDYPEMYAIFSEKEFTWEKIRQDNRNPILSGFVGADGLKTGHTEESGYGLVGSATQDGKRRIIVVNGLDSDKARRSESRRLMGIAFNDFATKTFHRAETVVGEAKVFGGKESTTPLVLAEDISMILHRSSLSDVKSTIVYEGPLKAPVKLGQQVGYLRVDTKQGSKEYPLFSYAQVDELGFFGKVGLAAKTLLIKPPKADKDGVEDQRGS